MFAFRHGNEWRMAVTKHIASEQAQAQLAAALRESHQRFAEEMKWDEVAM